MVKTIREFIHEEFLEAIDTGSKALKSFKSIYLYLYTYSQNIDFLSKKYKKLRFFAFFPKNICVFKKKAVILLPIYVRIIIRELNYRVQQLILLTNKNQALWHDQLQKHRSCTEKTLSALCTTCAMCRKYPQKREKRGKRLMNG